MRTSPSRTPSSSCLPCVSLTMTSRIRASRAPPNGSALGYRPPVNVPGRSAGGGRAISGPRPSPLAAGGRATTQAPQRRPVSCSALLGGINHGSRLGSVEDEERVIPYLESKRLMVGEQDEGVYIWCRVSSEYHHPAVNLRR